MIPLPVFTEAELNTAIQREYEFVRNDGQLLPWSIKANGCFAIYLRAFSLLWVDISHFCCFQADKHLTRTPAGFLLIRPMSAQKFGH